MALSWVPGAMPWAIGAVVLNHALITGAGLTPRSSGARRGENEYVRRSSSSRPFGAGSASFAPCSASLRIKGAGSISLRIGE